ncbi:MAG: phytanoyl-CoA dioxygenase family protein [Chitinophagales bacterium]
MKNYFQKYTGFLRNLRFVHFLYNYFHRKGLQHNQTIYTSYGIKKSIYSSISHQDFKDKKQAKPWLDEFPNEHDIINHPKFVAFPEEIGNQLLTWHINGYIIWKNFLDEETVDAINEEMKSLFLKGEIDFNYTNKKIFNSYKQSYTVRKVIKDKRLLNLFSFILDRDVFPFQTINFFQGSEQKAHSDSIHMSTFPQGNMLAAWFALEDIIPEQGPISYYKGSHQLQYFYNSDYNNTSNFFMVDGEANEKYETKLEQIIQAQNLQKEIFLPQKGDVLIWHANLIHGGEPQINKQRTRKSMVAHYYANDVIAYHEISERPAIFDTELVGEVDSDFYKGQQDLFDSPF